MKKPEGWRIEQLGWAVSSLESGISESGEDREPWPSEPAVLKVSSVTGKKFDPTQCKALAGKLEGRNRTFVKRDRILVNRANGSAALVGSSVYVREDYPNRFLPDKIWQLAANEYNSTAKFLHIITSTKRFKQKVLNESSGGTGMKNIGSRRYLEIEVAFPPLPEQRKIADILTTWDEALTQLDALIEAHERRKKALMQQLLTGKKRLPGFKGKWKKVGLGDVAENVADQNKGRMGTSSLYGVTKADGVVPMRDHVKGESFDRCKRVETDWFAYNPMRINIGSIARWQGAETVMVSGDYVVFRCLAEKLLPAYLDHLRQSWMWQSFVTRGGNGSVRIRIYFSDLAEFTFPCPPIEEQRQIAALLDTADQQLTLLRTQRTALDQQKRGLMQRLLTGRLRVKI